MLLLYYFSSHNILSFCHLHASTSMSHPTHPIPYTRQSLQPYPPTSRQWTSTYSPNLPTQGLLPTSHRPHPGQHRVTSQRPLTKHPRATHSQRRIIPIITVGGDGWDKKGQRELTSINLSLRGSGAHVDISGLIMYLCGRLGSESQWQAKSRGISRAIKVYPAFTHG